jgi:hypothetical protein
MPSHMTAGASVGILISAYMCKYIDIRIFVCSYTYKDIRVYVNGTDFIP